MVKFILLTLILIFSSITIAASSESEPGTWRWTNGSEREVVQDIDFGQFRISEDTYLASFIVSCVDGVKVYSTFNDNGISSIIIPGRCDGKPESKEYYVPVEEKLSEVKTLVPVVKQSIGKIDW